MSEIFDLPKNVQAEGGWPKKAAAVLYQSGKDFVRDSGPQWAAAIAYYSLLSLFPLLLAAASVAAFFVDPEWAISTLTGLLQNYVPQGAGNIEQIVTGAIERRGSVSLLSLLALLWSGSRVFSVMTIALNIAYDVDESYGFLKRTLIDLIMVVTIGVLFVAALSSRYLIDLAWSFFNLNSGLGQGLRVVIQEAVPGLLLFVSFFLIYRFVPRRQVSWKAALPGALLATLVFAIARPLFIGYLNSFANYNLIYGSIAIVIILVFWAWMVASILLFGGEVVSHIQEIILEGHSREDVEQRHRQRAPVRRLSEERRPRPQVRHYDEQELNARLLAGIEQPPSVKQRRVLTLGATIAGALLFVLGFMFRSRQD